MSTQAPFDVDALLSWLSQPTEKPASAGTSSSLPDLDPGRPYTEGARGAENSADLKKVVGGGIDSAPASGSSENRKPVGMGGLEVGLVGERGDPLSGVDVVKMTPGQSGDDKMAADLADIEKAAAEWDKFLAEAGVSTKAGEPTPHGAAPSTKEAGDDAKRTAMVEWYKTAGERQAILVAGFNHGFATTTRQLHEMLADGRLAKFAADTEKEEAGDDDDDDDESGGGEGGASESSAMGGGGPPVGGGESTPAMPMPMGGGGGGPPMGGGGGGPPMGGGDMGGGMGGASVSLDEVAHAMLGAGMQPEAVAMVLQQLQQAPPAGMSADKLANVKTAAELARRVARHVMTTPYVVEYVPKTAAAAQYREKVRAYYRELLSAANGR